MVDAALPLAKWPDKHPAEKRLTLKLYDFWERVKCDSGLIEENLIDPQALLEVWDSCCLLQVYDLLNKDNYSYTFLGDKIAQQFEQVGAWSSDVPVISPVAKTGHVLFLSAFTTRLPLFDEGSITDSFGQEILYRQCVLPVGKQGKVEGFLAGIRLKVQAIS